MTVVLSVLYLKAPSTSTSADAKGWMEVVGKRNEILAGNSELKLPGTRFSEEIFSSCALIFKNKFLVGIQLRIL